MHSWLDTFVSRSQALRILVVGDSIGDGSSATATQNKWVYRLVERLKRNSSVDVSLTNLSVGGTTSLFGYHRIHGLSSNRNFDLVFVCFGENDAQQDFALYYEVLLRTIRLRWPHCEVISILESSQREYTPKMQTILSLAQKYGCGVCDTIKAFAQSGMKYEALTVQDRTHLNDEGQKVYADAAYEAIVHLALEKSQTLPTANESVLDFDQCQFINAVDMQYGLADYRWKTSAKYAAFNCLEAPEASAYKVFVNGREVLANSFRHGFYFVWERLYLLNVPEGEKEIRVTLSDETDVSLFRGILLIG